MSSMIFVDILAYGGSALGVVFLSILGTMLLRPRGAATCLSFLITDERARLCLQDGSLRPGRVRAFGTTALLFAFLFGICIVRSVVRP